MNKLIKYVNKKIDKHAPLKSKKTKIRNMTHKPWIQKNLQKCIKIKNSLYKLYIKEKNSIKRQQLLDRFKSYRNILTTLTRDAKSKYYKDFFEKHKLTAVKVWKGIKSLINTKTIKHCKIINIKIRNTITSDGSKTSNHFNKYFSTVGQNIDKDIVQSQRHFSHYLGNTNTNFSFYSNKSIRNRKHFIISKHKEKFRAKYYPHSHFKTV